MTTKQTQAQRDAQFGQRLANDGADPELVETALGTEHELEAGGFPRADAEAIVEGAVVDTVNADRLGVDEDDDD